MIKRKFKHKYGAVRCERDDIKFPSKLERDCYDWLQILKDQGKIRLFLRQIPFDLPGKSKHSVDFCVFTEENVLFVEAKGRDLAMGKLKRKQVEDLYPVDIHIAKSVSDLNKIIAKYK